MKKYFNILFLTALFALMVTPFAIYAQDTAVSVANTTSSFDWSSIWASITKYLPAWVSTILECLPVVLVAIQFVLKRIPTTESIKIGGIIGKILSILTFFQKDNANNGTTHS